MVEITCIVRTESSNFIELFWEFGWVCVFVKQTYSFGRTLFFILISLILIVFKAKDWIDQ